MNIEKVRNICREIAEKHGHILDVPVEENGRIKSTLGRVKFRKLKGKYVPEKIEFSKDIINGDENLLIDTIKHEMAHFLVLKETGENHNHDSLWKMWAVKLGCRPRATVNISNSSPAAENYKYVVKCRKCGKIIGKYRRASKVIKSPSKYRSACCNERIKVGLYEKGK